jgi:hypothetical protein
VSVPVLREGRAGVLRGAQCTHFGDPSDGEDGGVGAWGFEYRALYPDFPGIALPIPFVARYRLKQYQPVKVYNPANHRVVWCFLIDKGPSAALGRDADLLFKPWLDLGFGTGEDDPGVVTLDLRIPYLFPAAG